MDISLKKHLARNIVALVLFLIVAFLPLESLIPNPQYALYAEFALFLIPYLIAGHDVLVDAAKNIIKGHVFDECFLMSIATIGAFALVLFPEAEPHMAEGAAVMIFYQFGEWFEHYAVGKSRASIAEMMDIAPEYANLLRDGTLIQCDPDEIPIGSTIVIKAGERVPLDGIVLEGSSELDTSALTGESLPRLTKPGDEVISGCINLSGVLTVKTSKSFEDSSVMRILELVEDASDKKARTEAFITRFARYYTPVVVICALALAVLPPLLTGGAWADWIQRGLIFLVVSCPCALVISVPLSFFSGIGAASKNGILVKGSNYLEQLDKLSTIVFDKTGTLTTGKFKVSEIHAENGSEEELIYKAAQAEQLSTHPLAQAVCTYYENNYGTLCAPQASSQSEHAGKGISVCLNGENIIVGNTLLMKENDIELPEVSASYGSVLYVAINKTYAGYILVEDEIKADSKEAILQLQQLGIEKTIMLTGDRKENAAWISQSLKLSDYYAELLPQDKVSHLERFLSEKATKKCIAFVGDGINDAPVLMRSDIGIAMGALGSDAAIEAADIVLMDDKLSKIALAKRIARKTVAIVHENIVFALGVKAVVLLLASFGMANMWLAVFADVGVAALAILNAMRAMTIKAR